MRSRKYLLVPGNNSLSHIVKCLAISEALAARGHSTCVAVSKRHSPFLRGLAIDHIVLPDIQETDESGFPSVAWFRQPQKVIDCIAAEVDLIKMYRPDRVLGIFRLTLKASAQIAGVPYDSLTCGCMTPDFPEVLGYGDCEPGREIQQIILDGFFRYAGSKIGAALENFGLPKRNGNVLHMLKGERTFLWDFPEFAPLPQKNDMIHVGPIEWDRWPYDTLNRETLIGGRPVAIVAFGTCTVCLNVTKRIIRILIEKGYRVLLAAGGQTEFLGLLPDDPQITVYNYASIPEMLPFASLLVTHGGQMTIFEALQYQVPVAVMPFQPEQAHNGVCLERMGCGTRLVPSRPFQGNSNAYIDALDSMTDEEIAGKISRLIKDPMTKKHLAEASDILSRYDGAGKIADLLGEC